MSAQKANNTIDKVRQLQRKLYRSAKLSPKRKYHALYDKVFREDILADAWKRVKAKAGSGGIDHMTIQDVERYGVGAFLKEIAEKLKAGKYRPSPVKRTYIPKKDGKKRPLGLPIIRDKVVQMATKLVIEPIFEADFKECSYGFRPKRSQHMALEAVKTACDKQGYWVIDADIKRYFDNINHDKLMVLLKERITDRRILKLITQWLKAGVMEDGRLEISDVGTPQGGVISPLLSNIYLSYMDKIWEKHGKQLGTLVRFADDAVIICKTNKEANHSLNLVKKIMAKLNLELNEEKTKVVHLWGCKAGFDFLGFHNRYAKLKNRFGKTFFVLIQYPSKQAMSRMKDAVKEVLGKRSSLPKDISELIKTLNPKITGWRNYYGLKFADKWMKAIDWHILQWFTRWWNRKRQRKCHLSLMDKVRFVIHNLGLKKLFRPNACL